jgi:uncharacterized membrane protein
VARVGSELEDGIDRLFPGHLGKPGSESSIAPTDAGLPESFTREACPVDAFANGYLQRIDIEALMALARKEDLLLRLECRPGHYIVKDRAMVMVWPGDRVTETLVDKLNAAFVIGNQRTATQDVEFSFHQLVEIAVRALSPGINDPFTAIVCVDRLGSALCRLAQRDIPSALRFDPDGRLRLVAPGPTFAGIVDTAFNQIRQSARSNPAVAIRMLDTMAQIAGYVQSAADAACLQRQASMIVRGAREAVPEPEDLLAVETAFMAATQALNERDG